MNNVTPLFNARNVKVERLTISPETLSNSIVAQIYEEPLFATDGSLRGSVWGVWNQHVVWERDGELRKTLIAEAFSSLPRLAESTPLT